MPIEQREETAAEKEHWRRIREHREHEKHVAWLEAKIENLEALLHEATSELNRYRCQGTG